MSIAAMFDPLPFRTPAAWAEAQRDNVPELLLEQAHLEKKAAAAAVAFLFRLAPDAQHSRRLSALAREELVHFERALKLCERRGITFQPQDSSGYAERLKRAVRRDVPVRLVDELLVAAIIEARSHERMALLAAAFVDHAPDVADLYRDLCPAEERHEELYLELACSVAPADEARRRHGELARHEAEVLRELPFTARLHGGMPVPGRVEAGG